MIRRQSQASGGIRYVSSMTAARGGAPAACGMPTSIGETTQIHCRDHLAVSAIYRSPGDGVEVGASEDGESCIVGAMSFMNEIERRRIVAESW